MIENKIEIENKRVLLNYADFRKYSDIFIETGSAAGDGIQRALNAGFTDVTSVEASEHWFNVCSKRFEDNDKVTLLLGKSTDFLKLLINKPGEVKPSVIFLDAHPSGEASAGHKELQEEGEKSEWSQDNIIKAELNLILKHGIEDNVIIIDDVNGTKDGLAFDYCKIMLQINPNYKFYFYDENLSGKPDYYYQDKILVAVPYD